MCEWTDKEWRKEMARKGVKEVASWQHLAVIVPISNIVFFLFRSYMYTDLNVWVVVSVC